MIKKFWRIGEEGPDKFAIAEDDTIFAHVAGKDRANEIVSLHNKEVMKSGGKIKHEKNRQP